MLDENPYEVGLDTHTHVHKALDKPRNCHRNLTICVATNAICFSIHLLFIAYKDTIKKITHLSYPDNNTINDAWMLLTITTFISYMHYKNSKKTTST